MDKTRLFSDLTVSARVRKVAQVCCASLMLLAGCGSELGPCDEEAARELVYGRNNLVATKGQALLHDSCGNAAFCHSSDTSSKNRFGAPYTLDYDMLPSPHGWPNVQRDRGLIWETIESGQMPPKGIGKEVLGDGDWRFDIARNSDSKRLPKLSSEAGKGVMRNWLACGAPVVGVTKVPEWALPGGSDGGLMEWEQIFTQIIEPNCSSSGCHDKAGAGGLRLEDACSSYEALLESSACGGAPRMTPGDGNSYLLDKLENDKPDCGAQMPTTGPLSQRDLQAIRAWVEADAPAASCQ